MTVAALNDGHVVWEPLPKQRVALACPAFELLYGGSKGGAKTNFLVACVAPLLAFAHAKYLRTGIKQYKVRILVFRKNLNDLEDFIVKTFGLYPYLDPQAQWHSKEKYWEFESGASVEINHLDDPLAHEAFNGNEITALLFDEVQFISFVAYAFLVAQLRTGDPDYKPFLIVRATANPGGPHGDWVYRHWHLGECPEGNRIFSHEVTLSDGTKRLRTRAFIRSYLRDNKYLDADYEAQLRSIWGPDEIRMYLDGDFDCIAGAFFSNLLRPIHFGKSKPVPASWDKIFSIDWGSTAPACCLWAAQDPDGRIHVIDELHQPGVTGRTFGEALVGKYNRQKWCPDKVYKPGDFWGVIDTQAMDRYGSEATAAAGIMEWGFRIFGADKNPGERAIGINQIKERLLMDRQEQPQMVIYEDRCPHLVRALKGIQSLAPVDPEDYDPRSPLAHAIDTLRFLCMKWPLRKVVQENKTDIEVARWNKMLKSRKGEDDEARVTGGYDR